MDTITIQKTETAIKTRASKGMGLYLSGAVAVHGDAYVVHGAARNYTVFFIGDEPRCDCPDYHERCKDAGHACKHGLAVTIFVARDNCRCEARPKTGHRH